MLPHQKLIYPCPFCGKETLEVLWWPSHKAAKRSSSAAAGSKITWRRMPEGFVLLSEKCSNCGKTAKEIEKEWGLRS
jgi:DNA-directed RNA polymerase subunit RPC12/RpoP